MRFEIYEGTSGFTYNGKRAGSINGDLDEARAYVEKQFYENFGQDILVLALTPTTIFAQTDEGEVIAVGVIG